MELVYPGLHMLILLGICHNDNTHNQDSQQKGVARFDTLTDREVDTDEDL